MRRRFEMEATADQIVDAAVQTNTSMSVLEHIVERRVEYLLGVLILHVTGLLEQALTYGSGICA